MSAAAQLRQRLEADLAERAPQAFTAAQRPLRELVSCGVEAMDAALAGGVPCGAVTELVGPQSSGRTSMALSYLAAVTRTECVAAWIDASDSFDPESAAANGVDLEHLLWVRCGAPAQRSSPAMTGIREAAPAGPAGGMAAPRHHGGGSPHPRAEGRDLPQAIGALLRAHGGLYDHQSRRERRSVGTPGAANRPLVLPAGRNVGPRVGPREEQVNADRLPARRGENLVLAARCAEPQPRRMASVAGASIPRPYPLLLERPIRGGAQGSVWQALDQAVRATDLVLQSGGFPLIVLDLGSTAAEFAWRIPLATWFRFRAACERTRSSLVLLTQHPCARSSAELVVRLQPGSLVPEGRVMAAVRYGAAVERSRAPLARVVTMRKPAQAERPGEWMSRAAWAQG